MNDEGRQMSERRTFLTEPSEEGGKVSTAGRLLSESASLFRQKGYARTTIRQLGDRVGIRGPSLYHHISSKEDLLHEICIRSLEDISLDLALASEGRESSPELLRDLIIAHTSRALNDRDMHATMLTEFRELSLQHRKEVVKLRADYEMTWRTLLKEGQELGWIRSDVDAKYLALTLLNTLNWTIFWYEPDAGLRPAELAEIFSKTFLEGAAGPVA